MRNLNPTEEFFQYTTLWSFPNRGDWATHNGRYRGNWSPYIPRNIIKRYSKENESILDVFMGSGTTLVEAKLLNRNAIGIDINPKAIEIAKRNLNFTTNYKGSIQTICTSAKEINFIPNNSIDLICTHPPYADIIKYSEDISGDLSLCNLDMFLQELQLVSKQLYRVLKPNKYCAFMMGDIRKNGNIIPLGFKSLSTFQNSGFKLKEIIIKEQHNCRATDKWIEIAQKNNFLLLAHEYLFVLKK